ncbi:Eukaryotic aspartyl protease [Aphelenchoides bicaudatus]|nr:Eukaryotic aspartyl protease [Aphelenchoides bicaudatus]
MGQFCPNNQVYDETKSSTAKATGDNLLIQYGIGSTRGMFYKDYFAFGDGANPSSLFKLKEPVMFGVGDRTTDGDMGILGLSYLFYGSKGTSIFEQAVKQGLMDYPIFTVFYKKCPANVNECDGGMITFGKHDRKNCGPVVGQTKIDPNDSHWKFYVDEVTVGNYKFERRVAAITDTGSSHLNLGPTVSAGIIREVVPFYKVPCDKKVEIKFKINGTYYEVPLSALSLELGNNECQLQMAPMESDTMWILGDPFIRNWCQIHDWHNRVVAFARPGPNQPGAEYIPPNFSGSKPGSTPSRATVRPNPRRPNKRPK